MESTWCGTTWRGAGGLTFGRTLVLVVPHHQQLGQAGHLGDLGDDPEQALDAVVGQHHGGEAGGARGDERQEEGAVDARPLLQTTRRTQDNVNRQATYTTRSSQVTQF